MTTGHGSTQVQLFPAEPPHAEPLGTGDGAVVVFTDHPAWAVVHVKTRAFGAAAAAAFLEAMAMCPDDGEQAELVPVCDVCGGPAHVPTLTAGEHAGHEDPARDADHEVEVGYRTAAEVNAP